MKELTEITLSEFSSLCTNQFNEEATSKEEALFSFQIYLLRHYYKTNALNIFNSQDEEIKSNQISIYKDFLINILLNISNNQKKDVFKALDLDQELLVFFDIWKINKEKEFFELNITPIKESPQADEAAAGVDKI